MRNIAPEPVGKVAPTGKENQQPAPTAKTILTCQPGGKWTEEVKA